MKEQLFEILHNRKRMPGERFSDIEGKIEEFFNQEVEKRIEERMPPAMYGWICPRCGAVHSPYSTACHCLPPARTWTGTSTGETEGEENG